MGREERRREQKRIRREAVESVSYKDRELFSKIRNGRVTAEDMEWIEKIGFDKGVKAVGVAAAENTMKSCYAAAALALAEQFDADQDTVCSFLQCMDRKVAFSLDSEEVMQQVFDELNISLNFKKTMDRITRKAAE